MEKKDLMRGDKTYDGSLPLHLLCPAKSKVLFTIIRIIPMQQILVM